MVSSREDAINVFVAKLGNIGKHSFRLLVSKAELSVEAISAGKEHSAVCQGQRVVPSCCDLDYMLSCQILHQLWLRIVLSVLHPQLPIGAEPEGIELAFVCHYKRMSSACCNLDYRGTLFEVHVQSKVLLEGGLVEIGNFGRVLILVEVRGKLHELWLGGIVKLPIAAFPVYSTTKGIQLIF